MTGGGARDNRQDMHRISRKLVKIGIILVAIGVTMALLCGLSGGVLWAVGGRDHVSDSGVRYMLVVGLSYTSFYACLVASLVTLAGGVGAGALGLTLKGVVLGTAYFHRP